MVIRGQLETLRTKIKHKEFSEWKEKKRNENQAVGKIIDI